jgi:GTPase SAR1 family protein
MVTTSFRTDALDKLCSENQMELLDSIDCLRLQGIDNYISLPQIIVCGDQSSGKSSVLEAISGVSFPVKSNLCTRFPTELVLRRTPQASATVSIVPHSSRSESEKITLSAFRAKLDGFDGISSLVEDAKEAMGISMQGKAFSKDLLRVEITGPDRPHLTIVDLPGLIHSETKQQMASDIELIQDVVQDYMKEARSIILAVVSAKNDVANQIVLKLARSTDTTGNRTLGVITKPDTLIPNSGSEALYMSLAKNEEVEFRLGWHVLKNMDSETGSWTLAQRDAKEAEFFLKRNWHELPRSVLGIDELRSRLSDVLLRQITSELPSLIEEIEGKYRSCHDRLKKLGEPRASLHEQRLHLVQISQSFQSLVNASVAGTYHQAFFDDAKSERGYQQRLRAVVQNLNQDFAKKLVKYGHYREITDSESSDLVPKRVLPITRDAFIAEIQMLMQRTRGRELPGSFNPMIVGDLFLEQSKPWEAVALRHVKKVWHAAKVFINLVVDSIADPMTSKLLNHEVFDPAMHELLKVLNAKTVELLNPHQKGHPITYNQYFTETLQHVRNERRNQDFNKIVGDFFKLPSIESPIMIERSVDLRGLVAALADRSEPDMDLFAASEALDCMNAYYKVSVCQYTRLTSIPKESNSFVFVSGCIEAIHRRCSYRGYRSQACFCSGRNHVTCDRIQHVFRASGTDRWRIEGEPCSERTAGETTRHSSNGL